jgi:hypothetical protein
MILLWWMCFHLTRRTASEHKDEWVRYYVARNSNATPELLLKAMEDENKDVRIAAKDRLEENPFLQLQVAALRAQKAIS